MTTTIYHEVFSKNNHFNITYKPETKELQFKEHLGAIFAMSLNLEQYCSLVALFNENLHEVNQIVNTDKEIEGVLNNG